MRLMLPTESPTTRSVVGVAARLADAFGGKARRPLRGAVLVVIDGLGAIALRAHAGHARTLTAGMTKRDVAVSVFPTTTAAALTSIVTGAWPGEHGLVGYRARDPRTGALVNQLSGWEKAGEDAARWQSAPTLFEQAAAAGHPAFAVGLPEYADSGFSRATLRGASFVSATSAAERVQLAYALAEQNDGALVYCYLPEIDKAGHRYGMDSAAWLAALEEVDAALRVPVPRDIGVLVTSDHGMIDVPAHRQLIIEPDDPAMSGVVAIGGEPRMLHVYLEPDADPTAAAERWEQSAEGAAMVATREEVAASGLFGPAVTDAARERIGDLVVVARGNRAIYDTSAEGILSRRMVGQHGALTPEERMVPALAWGALSE